MEHCEDCGREVSTDDVFCPTCGRYLYWSDRDEGSERGRGPGPSRPAVDEPGAAEEPPARDSPVAQRRQVDERRPDGRPAQERASHEDRSADDPSGAAPPHDGEHAPGESGTRPSDHRFGVAVALRNPDAVELTLGGEAVTELLVRNLGDLVDEFTVQVSGAPGAWVSAEPALVAVYPGQEAAIALVFAPPGEVEVPAGERPFRVVARSTLHEGAVAVLDGVVDVPPFTRLSLEISPEQRRTSAGVDFHVVLHNGSNHDVDVDLSTALLGHDGPLDLRLEQVELRGVAAFSSRTVLLHAMPTEESPEGPQQYPIGVEAVVSGAPGGPRVRAEAVLVHEPPPPPPPPPPSPAPSGYVAAVLGWLLGGLVSAALLAGLAWIAFSRVGDVGRTLAALILGLGGFWLGSTGGTWWVLRRRRAWRAGRTAALVALLTPVWAVGAVAAASAWEPAGAAVALLLPPAIARWVVLRVRPAPVVDR